MADDASNSDNDDPPAAALRAKHHWCFRLVRAFLWALVIILLTGTTAWSVLAIYFAGLNGGSPRLAMASIFAALIAASLIFVRPFRRGVSVSFALFAVVLSGFFSLKPSNDRAWATDVAAIPSGEISGDVLRMHNVRNFDYRSKTDFTPRWDDRAYDLTKLRTLDLMLVYWGSPAIAHAMVSFGFDDGQYLAVSIEARREKAESYSAVQGFFRQFELIYIFADERDVIRLRTNFRKEDVYLFRSTLSASEIKSVLLSYVANATALNSQPQFYNALTTNCATSVLDNARGGNIKAKMSWRVLLSGYVPQQLYDNHRIDTSLPFDELFRKSLVNRAAIEADQAPDFSEQIRVGLPRPATSASIGRRN